MAQSGGQDQPSMEEILASIRRIISDDEAVEEERPAASPVEESPGEEVLELTERVSPPDPPPADQPVSKPAEDSSALSHAPESVEPPPRRKGFFPAPLPPLPLLPWLRQRGHRQRHPRQARPMRESQTLDALVRQALTPLLKAWLDQNLPQLVERIVREEVRRLAQQAQDH